MGNFLDYARSNHKYVRYCLHMLENQIDDTEDETLKELLKKDLEIVKEMRRKQNLGEL